MMFNMCFEIILVNIYGVKFILKIVLNINIYVCSNCCICNCLRLRILKINNLYFWENMNYK